MENYEIVSEPHDQQKEVYMDYHVSKRKNIRQFNIKSLILTKKYNEEY